MDGRSIQWRNLRYTNLCFSSANVGMASRTGKAVPEGDENNEFTACVHSPAGESQCDYWHFEELLSQRLPNCRSNRCPHKCTGTPVRTHTAFSTNCHSEASILWGIGTRMATEYIDWNVSKWIPTISINRGKHSNYISIQHDAIINSVLISYRQTVEVENENHPHTINLKMFMNRSTHSAWQVRLDFWRQLRSLKCK